MVFQLDEEELASRESRFSWLLMDYPSRWSLGDEDRCRDESKMLDMVASSKLLPTHVFKTRSVIFSQLSRHCVSVNKSPSQITSILRPSESTSTRSTRQARQAPFMLRDMSTSVSKMLMRCTMHSGDYPNLDPR